MLILVVGGLLGAFAIAPRLWLSHALFVPIPVNAWPLHVPAPFDAIVLAVLVVLLLPLPFLRRPRMLLLAWLALFLVRSAWDVAAWQPYFIQYACILGALACIKPGIADDRSRGALNVARLVVIGGYFWAGVAKIDARFINDIAPIMLEPIVRPFGIALPAWSGALVPAAEVAIALMLASRRLRTLGIIGALATHAIILWSIGPLGMGVQAIVWPWNLALAGLVVALFHGDRVTRPQDLLWTRGLPVHAIAVVLFVIVPAASYVVPIEPYLAQRVYSSKIHEGELIMSDAVVAGLPARSREALDPMAVRVKGGVSVRIAAWVESDLGAYLSPSAASYRHVARNACRLAASDDEVVLELIDPPDWRTGEITRHRLTCKELEAGR